MNIETFDMSWVISRLILILANDSFVLHQEQKHLNFCQDMLLAFYLGPLQIADFNQTKTPWRT